MYGREGHICANLAGLGALLASAFVCMPMLLDGQPLRVPFGLHISVWVVGCALVGHSAGVLFMLLRRRGRQNDVNPPRVSQERHRT